ncbi:MAG TPA: hypothetical protein VEX88_10385 [Glaciibacter sp.]|nr:hypothetical protein [Glaciibacter sp.]
MSARVPLPESLPPNGFTVAAARSAGVHPNRLNAADLDKPHWGVRMPASGSPDFPGRCTALASALPPHVFFSGVSAAALIRIPVPLRFEPATDPLIEVSVAEPARAIRRPGVRGRKLGVTATDIEFRDGIRMTTPARTWCDLAPLLTLAELVAAGDYLVFHERRMETRETLAAAVAAHPGRRWRPKLKRALALLSDHSESPKESELRVVVVTHGLPVPLINVSIYTDSGRFVARVDVLFEDFGEILEYQGDHHRTDVRQWRRDRIRESELESMGYHVTEVVAEDLADPAKLIRRIAANLRRRGWTGHPSFPA